MGMVGKMLGGGGGVIYRMRGFDSTLGRVVFWQSSQIDASATSYGGPGPVSEIVVQNVIGQAQG